MLQRCFSRSRNTHPKHPAHQHRTPKTRVPVYTSLHTVKHHRREPTAKKNAPPNGTRHPPPHPASVTITSTHQHNPGTRALVGQGRLELPTSRLSSARSDQLSYWPSWWRRSDSNRRPAACKAAALPAELRPRSAPGLTPETPGSSYRTLVNTLVPVTDGKGCADGVAAEARSSIERR